MEVPLAVIPPREPLLARMEDLVGVDEPTRVEDRPQARALVLRHMGRADERRRVVDVLVRRRDVGDERAGPAVGEVGDSSTEAVQRTRVLPAEMRQEPSA